MRMLKPKTLRWFVGCGGAIVAAEAIGIPTILLVGGLWSLALMPVFVVFGWYGAKWADQGGD